MKKTCMNCRKYHAILSSDEGSFHVHNWCEQWNTVLNADALADTMETGEAFCYMFEPVDTPSFSDEWFDENKAENELNRKRTEIKDKISK